MKFYSSNTNFNQFHFLKTVYTWFHLDKIILFFLFINHLPCQKNLYGNSFNENETAMG
jgi:hypothetical protein